MLSSTAHPIRNLQRWRVVQAALLHYGFDMLIDREEIVEVRRFVKETLHMPAGQFKGLSQPERIRLMLQDLGPTFVKLGQILSSRSDLLSEEWIEQLSRLQDDVPSFPFEQARAIIESELGAPIAENFLEFESQPIAAASIGQVHRAKLPDGTQVVIKVQRPNIQAQVAADMDIMREIARLFETRTSLGKRLGLTGVVDEFSRSLRDEMDYRNEAANADRLRRNLADYEDVHVPIIYWELVTTRVLTMEAVEGVKASEIEKIKAAGIDTKALADTFIHTIFQQLLLDGFFHADPHPGNLLINLESGCLNYIDLGMMGSLLSEQRELMAQMVKAILRRDSREVVRLVMQVGTPIGKVKESPLRRSVDQIINRYLDASLSSISFAQLMNDILRAVSSNGIRLPSEFSLAIKTLVQGETIARSLDPDIQIIEIIEDVSRQILWQQLNPQTLLNQLSGAIREANRLARSLPHAAESLLTQMENGSLHIGLDIPDFQRTVSHITTIANRLTAGLIIAGMIIGSAIAMGISPQQSWSFLPVLGIIGFILSMTVGGFLVWNVFLDIWRHRK